jgi:Outer membrane protein beta-barrel family/CarboxypepD_reg-like domain
MNARSLLLLLAILPGFYISGRAQSRAGLVKGQVMDSSSRQILADASVTVTKLTDSSTSGFAVTDRSGNFKIADLDDASYRLSISFQGYKRISKRFTIDDTHPEVDLGILYLRRSTELLDEVIVERPPIELKDDTVEYNASAFKVKPNAFAEDMLKKLPGVQVDKDGNVTAQGEQIQKVYVDGKEFFGTDPKLATKNITADMIESVQVFDDMSDQAKFTHIDDGSRQKALNIKLKKDKRVGYFGRGVAGYGTDSRYQSTLTFNRFNEDQRFSVIGADNNINVQGFNFSDIVTSMGGYGSRGAGGGGGNFSGGFGGSYLGGGRGNAVTLGTGTSQTGITKAISGGINYTDKIGAKLQITSSYFYSNTDNLVSQSSLQHSFFPEDGDSVTNITQNGTSENINRNHRFNMRLEYALDTSTSILYIPNLTLQHSESRNYDTLFTQASKDSLNYLANQGFTNNSSVKNGTSFNEQLLIRHRFHTPGRTITIGLNNTINYSKGNGTNFSPLQFYNTDGSFDSTLLQDLQTSQVTRANNNVLSMSYTEPVGTGKLLELNYAYTNNFGTSDNKAFNYDSISKNYSSVNAPLTNYFGNGFYANRVGMNFRVVKTKYNFQLGMGVQFSELSSHTIQALTSKDTTIKQNFVNLFPVANFNYKFSRTQNLRISYRGHTNQPSIAQLQNVEDVSNPLQVKTGNPALKEEFENNLNIRYNSFNPSSYKFLSINIILDNQYNNIVNSIDSLRQGVQIIKPVNMSGTYSGSSFITLGIPLKGKFKGSNFNFNNSISYNHTPSLLYGEPNFSSTLVITQTAGINLDFHDKLNLGLSGSLAYNQASYSAQASQNNTYYQQTYTADISWYFIKDWILYTDFNEYINSGRTAGFNQTIPLWNASIAREFLKKRNAEIKFSVNDILNQNQSITRTIGDNYTLDTRSSVLKQYFMLTFTYNLNRAGAGTRNNNGMPGIPRNIQRQIQELKTDPTPAPALPPVPKSANP